MARPPQNRLSLRALTLSGLLAAQAQAAAPPQKPPLPDYDGRGGAASTAGEKALWVPRVAAAPLFAVSEYVIRRPLGWLVTTAERDKWPAAIFDFFTFGPERKAGIIPTALLDFGFKPSVGVYFFWDDAFVAKNAVRVHAATWGENWLSASLVDRFPVGSDDSLVSIRAEAVRRPDYIFHGFGPRSTPEARSRYSSDRLEASAAYSLRLWRSSSLSSSLGLRSVKFEDRGCCEDSSIGEASGRGHFALPAGFGSGYKIAYQKLGIAIDSRQKRPAAGSGLRLELDVEQAIDLERSRQSHWFRYGGSLVGFLDLNGRWRVLSLAVTMLFADPTKNSGPIPFTEQVILGGSGPMRGFMLGRLNDRSAAIATLQYQWPIWVWLDGATQLSMGNVFGAGLEGFEAGLCRLSWTMGLRTVSSPDHSFEILGGFGTEPLNDGAHISSARIVFGATKGF